MRLYKFFLLNIDSDWGWINFLCGIMVSSAINTATGYSTSKAPSEFSLLSSFFTLTASVFLFALYQTLTKAKRQLNQEIETYNCVLSTRDLVYRKKEIWSDNLKSSIGKIRFLLWITIIAGMLGLVVCLILCYFDVNMWSGEGLQIFWRRLWKTT